MTTHTPIVATTTDTTRTASEVLVGEAISCPDQYNRLRVQAISSVGTRIHLNGYISATGEPAHYDFANDDKLTIHTWLDADNNIVIPDAVVNP